MRRSEAILFLPPNVPPPSPPDATASMPPSPPPPPSPSAASPPAAPDGDLNLSANTHAQASGGDASRPLVMAYYPDWAGGDFPPEKIDFGRFDWIDFAFAVPDERLNLTWDGSDDAPDLLRRLVTRAHGQGKKVKLSVGGWTGSRYFSAAAASAQNRETLARNILALYTQFGLDGIDLDWEYPAQDGNAGNLVSPADSANFLAFLTVLRSVLPPDAVITAATQTVPFAGADGDPLGDVSAFAKVLDWVLLMNYDTWGCECAFLPIAALFLSSRADLLLPYSPVPLAVLGTAIRSFVPARTRSPLAHMRAASETPGPNAPLSDACGNTTQGSASALAALRTWTAAGFPASQLVLGVPSYGYISRSSASLLRTRAPAALPPAVFARRQKQRARRRSRVLNWVGALVDKAQPFLAPGRTLVVNEDGGTDGGQVQFRELVRQGIVQPYAGASNASRPSPSPGPALHASYTRLLGGSNPSPADVATAEAVRAAVENREPRALFAGAGGFAREWDACSSTPFLRSAAARQVVAYDDPVSLEMKAQLAREAGMRGVNMFDVHGDTDGWDLADAILRGLGVK
ncbi:glycoside hydrolase superfamily [Trametes elegans]|nr:glycoside hydrolase superfamily [Trametes elegans]